METWIGLSSGFRGGGGIVRGVEVGGGFGLEAIHQQQCSTWTRTGARLERHRRKEAAKWGDVSSVWGETSSEWLQQRKKNDWKKRKWKGNRRREMEKENLSLSYCRAWFPRRLFFILKFLNMILFYKTSENDFSIIVIKNHFLH